MKTIFVGGIHGAGKSSLCDELARELRLSHYSAGVLLAMDESEAHRNTEKQVVDVTGNQGLIVSHLERLTERGQRVVLDGHFALLRSQGGIVPVPVEFFRVLSPIALLLMDTLPPEARYRLQDRDGLVLALKLLERLRLAELRQARVVSKALSLPLRIIEGQDAGLQALQHVSGVLST